MKMDHFYCIWAFIFINLCWIAITGLIYVILNLNWSEWLIILFWVVSEILIARFCINVFIKKL